MRISFLAPATTCKVSQCNSKDCRCPLKTTPGFLAREQTPKLVLFTQDDGIEHTKFAVAMEMLDGRTNPNGCPIRATFYYSGDSTITPEFAKKLYDEGKLVTVHRISSTKDIMNIFK